MPEAVGFACQSFEILLFLRLLLHHAVGEHFGVEFEGRQRGAQFVRDAGDKRRAALAESHHAAQYQRDGGHREENAKPRDAERGFQWAPERHRCKCHRAGNQPNRQGSQQVRPRGSVFSRGNDRGIRETILHGLKHFRPEFLPVKPCALNPFPLPCHYTPGKQQRIAEPQRAEVGDSGKRRGWSGLDAGRGQRACRSWGKAHCCRGSSRQFLSDDQFLRGIRLANRLLRKR